MKKTVLITGSSGFLGSAVGVDLAKICNIIAVDLRPPTPLLKSSAPGVFWECRDIADPEFIHELKKSIFPRIGRIDIILHFAAYYDFEKNWGNEYERVNIYGTEQLINAALDIGVKRIIFAGSIASLDPPEKNEALTEKSPAGTLIPYSRSKAEGEALLAKYADRLPAVVLRIGGVFSDWCELPPLFSLVKQWKHPGILGRLMPGEGKSGFPFIHRKDLVAAVRRIVEIEHKLERYQVLFVSPDSYTSYLELFPEIRSCIPKASLGPPVEIPAFFMKPILQAKKLGAKLLGKQSYERVWMLKFLDKPFIIDPEYSRAVLEWRPCKHRSIKDRIPVIVDNAIRYRARWEERNIFRSENKYCYQPD